MLTLTQALFGLKILSGIVAIVFRLLEEFSGQTKDTVTNADSRRLHVFARGLCLLPFSSCSWMLI